MIVWQVLFWLGEGTNLRGYDGGGDAEYDEEDDQEVARLEDEKVEARAETLCDAVFTSCAIDLRLVYALTLFHLLLPVFFVARAYLTYRGAGRFF